MHLFVALNKPIIVIIFIFTNIIIITVNIVVTRNVVAVVLIIEIAIVILSIVLIFGLVNNTKCSNLIIIIVINITLFIIIYP